MKEKGQITIFVIIAIVIVSIIALFLLARSGVVPGISTKKEVNPNLFLHSCLEDKVNEGLGIILIQGGKIKNPLNKSFQFSDEKEAHEISYLCYTESDNRVCINQNPLLISSVEKELHGYILDDVETCFDDLVESLEKEGYGVDKEYNGFLINLRESGIGVSIDGKLNLEKNNEATTQENFGTNFESGIYNLLLIAQGIVNQEVSSCDFNYALFVLNYPEFNIDKTRTSDSEVIYRVKDKKKNEEFRFAVRGCVISL